jgi:hypothetical protein
MAFAARCDAIGDKLVDVKPSYPSEALAGLIVPHDAITQAGKAAGKSKGLCYVIERDAQGLWWLMYGNARVHFTPIDGSFPEWRRIVPEMPALLTAAHYNPAYMVALGNMSKALRDGKKDASTAFRLHQDGDKPALVTFLDAEGNTRTDCIAVLMPMRIKAGDYSSAIFAREFQL